ncbi:hypothetical protein B0H14DRAFT_2583028 [Mycena olivaceomarginata]|nr:hypothetical protein B0H14DRAFT_2583028 [Mycena olivaceomarginata]
MPKREEFIQASTAQALTTHNTEVAAAAELAQTQALLCLQQNLEKASPENCMFPYPTAAPPQWPPARRHRLPTRYRDELPESRMQNQFWNPVHFPPQWVQTEPNAFGVYKVFPKQPTHDPEDSSASMTFAGHLLYPPPNHHRQHLSQLPINGSLVSIPEHHCRAIHVMVPSKVEPQV